MMRTTRKLLLLPAVAGLVMLVLAGSAAAFPSTKPFEIVPGSFSVTASTDRAGAHEDLTTSLDFAHEPVTGVTYNDVRTITVNLPAGFTASNTAVPTCSDAQLLTGAGIVGFGAQCPQASQVGQVSFEVANPFPAGKHGLPSQDTVPLYNLEDTSTGVAAELGFKTATVTQVLVVRVRPSDTGLSITTPNIPRVEAHNIKVTVWGLPASHEHDAQRGEACGLNGEQPPICHNEFGGPQEAKVPVRPFLSNPTGCGTFTASMEADSWEEPDTFVKATSEVGPIAECERVPFDPTIEVQPTTESAESPTGLDVSLVVPQSWENPFSLATANLQDTSLALPEGMTANPSLAAGLGACTVAQYESETAESPVGAGCPPESKIGSIEIETPLLAEKIPGAIYIATPYENQPEFGTPEHPGGSLLALYVVAKDPAKGIIIKVAGKIEPNPVTGQLVTTFQNTPQQPFNRFTLKFRPGATAPLVSPPICGSYSANAALTPWSAPTEPVLLNSLPFQVSSGVREGACPAGGAPPFKPQVIAYPEHANGGAYSPFYLRIIREDGEQEITRFSTTLPPGLSGNLTGIPFCPEADIEAAKSVTGAEEEERPSCPVASEIGHTIVSAGVGTVLAQNPGKVYLAGPYHGAPLSIVSITSAKVGPFDLGTVVIRFALDINPTTAQVEVSGAQSDPIPHILRGIVVHVREIRVYMDREKFIINPTSCNPLAVTDTIDGSGADPANPADQVPVSVSTPFEAADCSSLQFNPGFKVATSGRTSKANGASLSVKLTVPGALGTQANIAKVKVELPKQLPSRLTTLQKACTAAVFEANPADCPAASIVGQATATTPILPVPLTGPAYFVSHGGEAFPSLIVVLQGYGITVDLVGSTFISKGVTSSTFKTVPDVPVGSFELTLPQGPFSALAAVGNLCKSKLLMPTEFLAQNGAVLDQSTKVAVTGCPKAKKASHRKKTKGKKGRKAGAKGRGRKRG
jgi:hypothetical protein